METNGTQQGSLEKLAGDFSFAKKPKGVSQMSHRTFSWIVHKQCSGLMCDKVLSVLDRTETWVPSGQNADIFEVQIKSFCRLVTVLQSPTSISVNPEQELTFLLYSLKMHIQKLFIYN